MNIQNAFTFTKYKGYDPEVGAYNYDVLTRGIDNARILHNGFILSDLTLVSNLTNNENIYEK